MLLETAAVEFGRKNQDTFADFFHGLGNLVERGRERLDVLAFQRRDECLAELLGQLLCDLFILSPAVDKFIQARGRIVMFQLRQKGHEMMDAAVGLLRAGFEQVEELLVVSKEFPERKHKIYCRAFLRNANRTECGV